MQQYYQGSICRGDGGDYPRHWFSRSPPLVLLKTSLAGILFIPCTAKMLRTSHPVVCDCEKNCKKIFACGELSSIMLFNFFHDFINYLCAIETELFVDNSFNFDHDFINYLCTIVTEAVRNFRLRRAF